MEYEKPDTTEAVKVLIGVMGDSHKVGELVGTDYRNVRSYSEGVRHRLSLDGVVRWCALIGQELGVFFDVIIDCDGVVKLKRRRFRK
jgi:hypothetical protein